MNDIQLLLGKVSKNSYFTKFFEKFDLNKDMKVDLDEYHKMSIEEYNRWEEIEDREPTD